MIWLKISVLVATIADGDGLTSSEKHPVLRLELAVILPPPPDVKVR